MTILIVIVTIIRDSCVFVVAESLFSWVQLWNWRLWMREQIIHESISISMLPLTSCIIMIKLSLLYAIYRVFVTPGSDKTLSIFAYNESCALIESCCAGLSTLAHSDVYAGWSSRAEHILSTQTRWAQLQSLIIVVAVKHRVSEFQCFLVLVGRRATKVDRSISLSNKHTL